MGTSTRLILGVVNLLLFLRPRVNTQHCSARINPPELDGPESWPIKKPPFDTAFMSSFVHSFLSSVQPNPFPKDLFIKILKYHSISDEATINEVLRYEVGFLVCVAIGILYIILMPLIGLCFACCRCCGNCGGRMYQEQTNSINCRRRSFYWATFLFTLLILAGNISMFLSNTYTHENVSSAPGEFSNALKNLQSYIANIPEQIQTVVNESCVIVDNVTYNVQEIGSLLGKSVQREMESSIIPALNATAVMAQVVQNTSLLLHKLDATQKELDLLQSNLTRVNDRINNTLHNPSCIHCDLLKPELDKFSLDTSMNFPGLRKLQTAVDQAEKADLNKQTQKGKEFLENIPEMVTNRTTDITQRIHQELQTIREQLLQATTGNPIKQLNEVSNTLSTVQEEAKNYTPSINMAEKIRWIIGVILCCFILLVVVCNLLGLMLGSIGLVPKGDPTARSGTANCGGLFLMAGVGFSFLISWIFMIVVLILFVVGGNTYMLVCVPWKTQQIFQIIDTPGVIPGFNLSQSLGLKTNLPISNVYNDCQMNKSLWITLHLEDIINLNDYLNISKFTGEVQEAIESSNITLPNIVLLDSKTKKQLSNFSAMASSVNLSSITHTANTPAITQLGDFADELERLANSQTSAAVKAELEDEVKDLRLIQTQINSNIKPQLKELESDIAPFNDINSTVENVLKKVGSAQDVLNNTAQNLKSKLIEFVDCEIGVFTALAKWVNQTITEQVGRCGLVAVSVNSVENLFCSQFVDSLNAFWFSLGWCMVFLIPSIIFSVKLAKFYRRMKYKDELLENMMMMNPFPRDKLKSS